MNCPVREWNSTILFSSCSLLRNLLWIAILSGLLIAPVGQAVAEVTTIRLPVEMSDFAIHPHRGDIAAVSPTSNCVYLFRADDLAENEVASAERIELGAFPHSIVYKQFGEQEYWAVVCLENAQMTLISTDDLSIAHRISLPSMPVKSVFCSQNSADPYLYYDYFTNDRDKYLGVIDLREMASTGIVGNGVMEYYFSVSSDGLRLYKHSNQGFYSMRIEGGFAEQLPVFRQESAGRYRSEENYSDRPNDLVAMGSRIYSPDLRERLADLEFDPIHFFKSRPLVIGISQQTRYHGRVEDDGLTRLYAASCNRFAPTGNRVLLPEGTPTVNEGVLTHPFENMSNFSYWKHHRLLVDELRERVFYAFNDIILAVPLEEFAIENEPYLSFDPVSNYQFEVGKEGSYSLTPPDDRIEVHCEGLPEGATMVEGELVWTPSIEQLGRYEYQVTFEYDGVQRTKNATLEVVQPSIQLPFIIRDVLVSQDGSRAVCVGGPTMEETRGKLIQVVNQLALVDLETEEVIATQEVPYSVWKLEQVGNYVTTFPWQFIRRVDFFCLDQLDLAETVALPAAMTDVSATSRHAFLMTTAGTLIYDLENDLALLEDSLITTKSSSSHEERFPLFTEGLYVQGVLIHPETLNRQMLSYIRDVSTVYGGTREHWIPTRESNETGLKIKGVHPISPRPHILVPGSRYSISLSYRLNRISGVMRRTLTWLLHDRSRVTRDQIILEITDFPAQSFNREYTSVPVIAAGYRMSVVTVDDRLYIQPVPAGDVDEIIDPNRLRIVPHQSTFTLTDGPSTELTHRLESEIDGATFELIFPIDGASCDAESGTVTLDNEAICQIAQERVVSTVTAATLERSLYDLREEYFRSARLIQTLLAYRPQGHPVAIPIRLRVCHGIESYELMYYVIAELPREPLAEAVRSEVQRNADRQVLGEQAEISRQLQERIDHLERQTNAASQRLEVLLERMNQSE